MNVQKSKETTSRISSHPAIRNTFSREKTAQKAIFAAMITNDQFKQISERTHALRRYL
jgi:hypothetical protein